MGRIGRQRKFKSVDPSHGFSQETDSKYDLAPKDHDIQSRIPRKMKRLLSASKVSIRKDTRQSKLDKSKRKAVKRKEKEAFRIKPGESRKEFFNRLDNQVETALNKAMMKTKTLSERRKSHLKKRDEKRKQKKKKNLFMHGEISQKVNNDKQEESVTDHVKFGEVVNEPPQISAKPRKAKTKQVAVSTMKLAAVLSSKSEDKCDASEDTKWTSELSTIANDKRLLEEERNKAISEYRKLKHRKRNSKFPMPKI
eukprot:gene9064-10032_t